MISKVTHLHQNPTDKYLTLLLLIRVSKTSIHLQVNHIYLFILYVALQPNRGLWPPHSRGFRDQTYDAPQSVGLLWTSDQSVAETST
jgi:hypothetical protein